MEYYKPASGFLHDKNHSMWFFTFPIVKNHSIVVFEKNHCASGFLQEILRARIVKNHSIPPVGMLWNFTKLPVVFYILVKNHCQWFSYAVVFYM